MFERTSFELLVTINGSSNPASFIRKYWIEKNLDEFASVLRKMGLLSNEIIKIVNQTMKDVNSNERENDCLLELAENLQSFQVKNFKNEC